MKTVHQYPVLCPHYPMGEPTDLQEHEMPKGAKLLHFVGFRDGTGTLWAEVDTDAPLERVRFGIFRTPEPIPEGGEHVHTHVENGGWSWHLYRYVG